MGNSIKYTTGNTNNSLVKGNFRIGTGDVGKGPSSSTGFYKATAPPEGGYRIYLNNENVSGNIAYHTAANDSELISFTNSIAGQSYTGVNQCFSYYATQNDKVVFNREYENIITNGLVFNMDAGFTPSYPKNGLTWYDISNSNDGVLSNGLTYDSNNGGTISYDGTDEYVSINGDTSLYVQNLFTLQCWAYFNSTGGGFYQVLVRGGINGFAMYVFYKDSNNKIVFQSQVNTNNILIETNSNVLTVNNWNHVVLTRNNGTILFYVNGSLVHTSTGNELTTSTTFEKLNIGGSEYFSGIPLSGKISNVQIYNRPLTINEIQQNFNSQKGRFGL